MQDQQYDGVVLEDKWGKSYLCSSCLLAYADLGEDSLTDGWGKAPEGNGIGDGGLAPAASSGASPAPAAKTSKPKGGGATAEQPVAAKTATHEAKLALKPTNDALEQLAAELVVIGKDI